MGIKCSWMKKWQQQKKKERKCQQNRRKRPNDGHKWINSPVSAPEATQDGKMAG